jgi:oligoendopeptidase F
MSMKNLQTGAEDVTWNLTDLYSSEQELETEMSEIEVEAEKFAAQYRGHVDSLTAGELSDSLHSFEGLQDRLGRALTYVFLNWCTNTEDAERGALLQRIKEQGTLIGQAILFYEIELIQMDESRAIQLLSSPELDGFRHYLEVLRLRQQHILSEPEEKILAEKSVTGTEAWSRFFDETLGRTRFSFGGKEITEQEILSKLHDSQRSTRRDAALSFTVGLRGQLKNLTYIFNTVLAEKSSDDRLRKYKHWLSSRNLSNEITDEAVDALISSVVRRYDLVARFYNLKKRILGLDQLKDFDRYAPVGETDHHYTWEEARDLVLEAYSSFHSEMGNIASTFFQEREAAHSVIERYRRYTRTS